MLYDTIAAISTPMSSAGIGIIRISGSDAFQILDRIFQGKRKFSIQKVKSHTIHYGHIIDPVYHKIYDEVLVSVMVAPNTYTRENVVEINTHGGIMVMQTILNLVLKNGARLAEPGEFTKRAFLNGRLDLSQAEAVMDIIHSKTELAMHESVKQLNGSVKKQIEEFKKEILTLIAHIEASIDYPEYDIDELNFDTVLVQCKSIQLKMENLMDSYHNGKIIREGIKTVIVGKPNVGKSSILNALLKEQRAIVTEIAGTTRDTLEEYMNVHGIPLKLIDTAGIRETEDVVEKIGVSKSKDMIKEADLVLFVVNGSEPLTNEDLEIIQMIQEQQVIILLNKSDLEVIVSKDELIHQIPKATIIETSAIHYTGLSELENTIKNEFMHGKIFQNDEIMIHNIRHKNSLMKARDSIEKVIESIERGMPEDCWAIDIRDAYDRLSEITGDLVNDDVIAQIFSQFCLGK